MSNLSEVDRKKLNAVGFLSTGIHMYGEKIAMASYMLRDIYLIKQAKIRDAIRQHLKPE